MPLCAGQRPIPPPPLSLFYHVYPLSYHMYPLTLPWSLYLCRRSLALVQTATSSSPPTTNNHTSSTIPLAPRSGLAQGQGLAPGQGLMSASGQGPVSALASGPAPLAPAPGPGPTQGPGLAPGQSPVASVATRRAFFERMSDRASAASAGRCTSILSHFRDPISFRPTEPF